MPVIVPPVQASLVSRCVSVYVFVAASCAKVGSPSPVIFDVPIAIAPDIVPPVRFSFRAS